MFPLKKRILIRGCNAHIKAGLGCGGDYVADQDDLFAPFDGNIRTFWGHQGGNWLELTRDNGERIRMAHIERYVKKTGRVREGEKIAISGNTGAITTGPHLHLEAYNNSGKRLDPESYLWDTVDMTCEQELAAAKKFDAEERVPQIKRLQAEVKKLTGEVQSARQQFEDEKVSHRNTLDVLEGTRTERDKALADLKICQESGPLIPEQKRILAWFNEGKALLKG